MNDDLKARIEMLAKAMGIPLIGFASTVRWEDLPFKPWMPPEFYPQNVMPGTKTVIVIGLPVTLPILETTPSVLYHELYKTVNILLDQYAYRIASFLEGEGHSAVGITRDGYAGLDVLRGEADSCLFPPPCRLLRRTGHVRSEQYTANEALWPKGQVRLDPNQSGDRA